MRLTRSGWAVVLLLGLALASAATTGNNLLYLIYGSLLGLLAASAVLGRLNLRRLEARAEWPERVFAGGEFTLALLLRNAGTWPSFAVQGVDRVAPGETQRRAWRMRLAERGRAKVALTLESAWPFGLMLHRRKVEAEGLVLPRLRDARTAAELKAEARPSGRPSLKKGRSGEELFGVREHGPADDSRLINWKLTAKTGRPVVVEHATPHESKVTVRLSTLAEVDIEEAASACRYHLDNGAEVRLITPAADIDYGRGRSHLDALLRHLAELGGARTVAPAPVPEKLPAPELRRLLDVATVLVYAAMFLIEEVSRTMLLTGIPLLVIGFKLRGRAPKALWTAASLFLLVYITAFDWRLSGVTVANAHLLLYLILNRTWSDLEERELPQTFLILFLAVFLVSGLTISLWYFPFFLTYAAMAASWLTLYAGARPRAGMVASIVAAVLLVAVGAFALTPRVEAFRRINPFIATGIDKLEVRREATIAFSENVSLGFFGELKRSSARALRIKPLAAPSRPGPLRVRGGAFETFDGRRWSKGKLRGRGTWLPKRGRRIDLPGRPGPTAVYDVTVFPMGLSIVFTVDAPATLEADDTVYFDQTDTLYFAQPYLAGTRYRLHSQRAPLGFAAPAADRFLQLPAKQDPRVVDLARQLTQGLEAQAAAEALESHLRERYGYSAFSDSAERTLEQFLFETRRGNCEYFATAMAVLLRHAGVPSRLVTGFYSDEWNEFGDFYDVRQGQAHAWVEAYIAGRGWVTYDPTPAQGAFSARADAFGRKLERWFNAVQAKWYVNVIGYDQYVQRNTFRRLGLGLTAEALLPWVYRAAGAAAVLIVLFGARGIRWRRRPEDFFSQAQARLERRGFKRQPWWTPREYAEHVGLPELRELAELHYVDRYGRALSADQEQRARRLLRDLTR